MLNLASLCLNTHCTVAYVTVLVLVYLPWEVVDFGSRYYNCPSTQIKIHHSCKTSEQYDSPVSGRT